MSEKSEIKKPTDLCVESKYTTMIAREKNTARHNVYKLINLRYFIALLQLHRGVSPLLIQNLFSQRSFHKHKFN